MRIDFGARPRKNAQNTRGIFMPDEKQPKKMGELERAIDDFLQENWRALFMIAFILFCFWGGCQNESMPYSK